MFNGNKIEVSAASNHGLFWALVCLVHFKVLESGIPLALSSYASPFSFDTGVDPLSMHSACLSVPPSM